MSTIAPGTNVDPVVGTRVVARTQRNRLYGTVMSERVIGGSRLITIELDETTSSVEVDYADFVWRAFYR